MTDGEAFSYGILVFFGLLVAAIACGFIDDYIIDPIKKWHRNRKINKGDK